MSQEVRKLAGNEVETLSPPRSSFTSGIADVVDRMDTWRTEHPYAATVAETAVVWAGKEVTRRLVHRTTDVRIGHGWQNTRFGQLFTKPAVAIAAGLLAAPLAEEATFRKTPSDMLDRRGHQGLQAARGYALATVFAAGHAGPEAIPLPQFVSGLNYWRLQRTRGTEHAVLAHVTNNTLALASGGIHRYRSHRKVRGDL